MPILDADRRATAAYIAPFVVYVALMGIEHGANLPVQVFYPIRCAISAACLLLLSRPLLKLRPSRALASIALGAVVFVVWIAPDRLFGYRHFWLFSNSLFGSVASSAPPELRVSLSFRILRVLGSTALVPIIEELFWRGWLMRWLIDTRFLKVPLGAYMPAAFWLSAILFASEHGPYWEVGLAAGVLYNWWIVRTRNLADCILAHSVTNGLLSVYVLMGDRWQYWL
jgi:CAAX prenyl protease-like protein